jgi:hypothetical protein
VLKAYPNYPLAEYRLALAHARKGETAQAEIAYRNFIEAWKNADSNIPELVDARQTLARSAGPQRTPAARENAMAQGRQTATRQ